MHYLLILINKAENEETALNNVENFLELFEGDLFDYYKIGGRWNNYLAPKNIKMEHEKWVKERFKDAFYKDGSYIISIIEEKDNRIEIQKKWIELGGKGLNPFFSVHVFENEKQPYNIVPVKDCLDNIKEVMRTVASIEAEREERWEELLKLRTEKRNPVSVQWAALALAKAYDLDLNEETTVYLIDENIEITDQNINILNDHLDEYYAIVVDIHR